MSCRKKYIRDGTHQFERLLDALLPENNKIEDRSPQQLLDIIQGIAQNLNFFNLENKALGTWENYFPNTIPNVLLPGSKQDTEPSFALLTTFLELTKYLKDDLNSVTGKHLFYYYQEFLRFFQRPPVNEQVHLIFEPGKNVTSHLIKKYTKLTAGPDENGNEKIYALDKDIIIYPAQIAALKSVYIDSDDRVYASSEANVIPEAIAKKSNELKWSAFGSSQQGLSAGERTMEEVILGFAIASPQLWLTDGSREIEFVFNSTKADPLLTLDVNLLQDIKVYLSAEKEWLSPTVDYILVESTSLVNVRLSIKVSLPPTDPPVIPLSDSKMANEFSTTQPTAKFVLSHSSSKYKYTQLRSLVFNDVDISVTVSDMKNLVILNENGLLDSNKPFTPFGIRPNRGSSLFIGSAEVFSKSLSYLSVAYTWENLPDVDFDTYYNDYDISENFDNQIFKAKANVLYNRDWIAVESTDFDLFNNTNSAPSVELEFNPFNNEATAQPFDRVPELEETNSIGPSTAFGFLQIQFIGAKNSPDNFISNLMAFGHQEYSTLYTDVAILKALGDTSAGNFPNSPYTPTMSNLRLGYHSSEHINISSSAIPEHFFHLEPFGNTEIPFTKAFNLLPQLLNEGNFYLGLTGIKAPLNISLLFQVAEGSAQANPENPPESIEWSYLAATGWVNFDPLSILTDTTQALQKSGIIEFEIGSDAIESTSQFTEKALWIQASISKFSEGVSQLIDISPNAVSASYIAPEVPETDEFIETSRLLPANSIKKLLVKDGKIKKISQPFPSFGGKSSESDTNYLTRVSERLRHKNRAVNVWDYERIVLEQFPEIYKVKCLEHASVSDDIAPGSITLLVISNLRNKNIGNPLEPKTGFDVLIEIKLFIAAYVSPFVEINVINPTYEQLLVDFKVAFKSGFDGGFYLNQLNEDIKRYLSPWAFEEGEDIVFGGKIYRSDILQFVENQIYVDYVADFKLYHIFDGPTSGGVGCMIIEEDFIINDFQGLGIGEMTLEQDFVIGYESEVAIGNTPRSILVSAPEHRIELLEDFSVCIGGVFGGIGSMTIEIDFITE